MNRYDHDDHRRGDGGWDARDLLTCCVIPFVVAFACVQLFHAIGV